MSSPQNSNSGTGHPFTVNATHALVIDQISWLGDVSTGQLLYGEINCTTGGNSVFYQFQVPSFGADFRSPNQDRIVGTVPLHVYCDANTAVTVDAVRNSFYQRSRIHLWTELRTSGYLLP